MHRRPLTSSRFPLLHRLLLRLGVAGPRARRSAPFVAPRLRGATASRRAGAGDVTQEIVTQEVTKDVTQVGMRLLKFCAKHDMQRIADNVQLYADPLNAKYKEAI